MSLFILNQRSLRNCYYNLALEEAICVNLCKFELSGGLRFWWNRDAIILGLSDPIEKNIPEHLLKSFREELNVLQGSYNKKKFLSPAISRRASGGGTVYQEMGWNLNFSIFINLKIFKELFPINPSYEILSSLVLDALNDSGIRAELAGKSDLSIRNSSGNLLKISGNAQFRKRDCLVHHGTLILQPELIEKVKKLLKHPPKEPEYRMGRTHENFITHLPNDFQVETFSVSLKEKLSTYTKTSYKTPPKQFFHSVQKSIPTLLQEKYLNSEFIFSR